MPAPHPISASGSGRARKTAIVALLLALSKILAAADQPPQEYEVKAAFLLNFTKFIEWPAADAESPFHICIFGEDPFGRVLDQMISGETVGGRKLLVLRIGRKRPASCQIVFAGQGEGDFTEALAGVAPGVLTVGEGAEFLRQGGMISFVVENRRVRFDVSQKAALKAGLRISSKLLSVARSVEK
jgi:hypothetical protein